MAQPDTYGACSGEFEDSSKHFPEIDEKVFAHRNGIAIELIAKYLLTKEQWDDACTVSESTGQPFEEVLIQLGMVQSELMKNALKLQELVFEDKLTMSLAAEALLLANSTDLGAEEALSCMGVSDVQNNAALVYVQILFDAGAISNTARLTLIQSMCNSSFSLCDFLANQCQLSPRVINASLQSLSLLMQNQINKLQAIDIVSGVFSGRLSLWEALAKAGLDKHLVSRCKLSLGELLIEAGIVSESERAELVEHALFEGKRLGELVLDHKLTSSRVVEAALGLQKLAITGSINKAEACQILNAIKVDGSGVLADIYAPFYQG
jgi:hypothetical protein